MPVRKLITYFFVLGLFFIPFNEYEGLSFLGEYSTESAVLFFIPAFLLIVLYTLFVKKLNFPYRNNLYLVLLLFIIWCIISTLLNASNVYSFYFKGTSGLSRFIRQLFSLILSSVIFFQVYWFVFKDKTAEQIFLLIRKTFFTSLVVVSIYGFIETLISFFGLYFLKPLLDLFGYLPFLEPELHVEGRISSVSYEPPFLAIYLITIAGWMFSFIITDKGYKRYFPAVAVLLLTFFSGSRTALIVVTIQFIVFLYFLYFHYAQKRIVLLFVKYALFFTLAVGIVSGVKFYDAIKEKVESLNFLGNLKSNPSNKSRLGIQYTSLLIFAENPVSGVGLGQQAYVARGRYPGWATKNNYEFYIFYKNKKEKSFPPGYNIYTRILAELGIIGFGIFLFLQYRMLSKAKKLIKNEDNNRKILGLATYISLVGLFINWMQIDSFRIYGVWISLAILIISSRNNNEQHNSLNTTLQ
ncbi:MULTISPECIES: O-antigen ligase family protein [Flavobacterium]|uniref:O-antigen ligase family protein n=1 Tax=Flavobacterium TaxID=237 RepID=UPI001FCB5068|nr:MULTISPECIES: O-antigen ligase family protein [Flavobacterium]UOK43165.1 O-antigen ligase family protein [Flavobacterium enshiense]